MNENEFQTLLESTKYNPLTEMEMNTLAAVMANTKVETELGLSEGTIASDVANFTPFLLPMLRRIYPTLIANQLLGVQPMSGPTGFIYNLTNRFVGTQGSTINPNVKAVIADMSITTPGTTAVVVGTVITQTTGTIVGTVVYVEPAVHTYVGGTTANSVASRVLIELAVSDTSFVKGEAYVAETGATDQEGVFTSVYSSEASFLALLPNYSGTYTTADGEVRGSAGNEMNEVGIAVERKSIEARTRKLRAEYTIEMYQDLKAMHGVLADQELMSLMSYEIKAQTDREVVDFVNANASTESDFVIGGSGTAGAVDGVNGRWEIEKYRMFATKLTDMSREIGRLNRRGAANKLLVSPKVLTMLESIGGFTASPIASTANTQMANGGVVGSFDNKFSVIVDNFAVSDYATVVYKGSNQDAVGVYAPYVPVSIQKVNHITTGQPALIAMTRYGLTTNPWQDSAITRGEKSPYAASIGIDFTGTVLA